VTLILLGIIIAVALIAAAYSVGARRIVKSFADSTPQTTKIESDAMEVHRKIVNEGEEKKQDLLNADRDHLLNELRNSVRPKR
jgi:hypothetical protein